MMAGKNKRPREPPQSDGSSSPSRKRFKWSFYKALLEPLLESTVRRVVCEVLDLKLATHPNAFPSSSQPEEQCRFHLRFEGQLPATLYTGSKIEVSDPDSVLHVILVDAYADTIVNTGPLSSIKVEIMALRGEFGSEDDDHENWTQEEFNKNVEREGRGKSPLVAGDSTVTLADGIGVVRGIFFTDNSSWIRGGKFKLGARKVYPVGGERIREATSGSFVVKHRRGELYKKHHPPRLSDEVWRLERIAKDGVFHRRLEDTGIKNVKDFLCLCMKDPSQLRKIMSKISTTTWTVIVEHAMKCVVDDNKFYVYRTSPDPQNVTVIFNSVYIVVKAGFNGYFLTPDQFTPTHKSMVQNITQYVYKNENVLVPMDELSLPGPARPLAEPLNNPSPTMEPQIGSQPCHNNNDQAMAITQPLTHPVEQELNHPLAVPNNPQFVFPQTPENSFPREDFFANFEFGSGSSAWSTSSFYQIPIIQTNLRSPEDLLRFPADIDELWNEEQARTELLFASNSNNEPSQVGMSPVIPAGFVHVSQHGKGKARWCKIRAYFVRSV